MQNHYRRLDLPDGASIERVRAAYAAALQVFLQRQKAGNPLPREAFETLKAAYAELGDPERKARYDQRAGIRNQESEPLHGQQPSPGRRETLAEPRTPDVPQEKLPSAGQSPSAGRRRQRRSIDDLLGKPPPLPSVPPPSRSRSVPGDVSLGDVSLKPGPSSLPAVVRHRLAFTGDGGEYFRIWIVNLLLNLVTLGLYSPWAKVRRERYFHRNTLLDGCGFDFHGRPLAILKGRILAYVMLVSLALVDNLAHQYYYLALFLALPLIPWLLLRSFIFRARNTSHRGLRLDFGGNYLESFITYVGYGFLTVITVSLALPLLVMRIKRFRFSNLSYGGLDLETSFSWKTIYGIFLGAVLIFLGSFFALIMLIAILPDTNSSVVLSAIGFLTLMCLAVVSTVSAAYIRANLANHVWNHVRLGRHFFESDQTFGELSWIVIGNTLLTFLTVGLYWPWARVRLARYSAEHLVFQAADAESLNGFVATKTEDHAAIGEEVADAFDFDIAL
ncbi:MAG: DUF898 family protein [Zoogloeaceae bacterium]|nr:DUF898 family protein [Zoogloeaceae bacterium]